jgi:fructose-1,6-bisphosphatase I
MAKKITVEEFVTERAGAELGVVFGAIAEASRGIEQKIRLAGLSDIYGAFGAVNVQGEQQQKLDVYANEELIAQLGKVKSVAAIVSEEDEAPVMFDHAGAEFAVIFDPLDGSSNIDVNVNVGTIFSITHVSGDVVESVLKPGIAQIAAGYVVYGPSTVMVIAFGDKDGVTGFTLDADGSFVLTNESMTMPPQGPYYSANEANAASWPLAYREFVGSLVSEGLHGKSYGARYIGSLVADFHRTLLKGGVFLYPPTEKAPKGKLRLLYEARPLALVAEKAGGAAVNGATRILDLAAEGVHERTPLVVGSKAEVEALQRAVMGVAE